MIKGVEVFATGTNDIIFDGDKANNTSLQVKAFMHTIQQLEASGVTIFLCPEARKMADDYFKKLAVVKLKKKTARKGGTKLY